MTQTSKVQFQQRSDRYLIFVSFHSPDFLSPHCFLHLTETYHFTEIVLTIEEVLMLPRNKFEGNFGDIELPTSLGMSLCLSNLTELLIHFVTNFHQSKGETACKTWDWARAVSTTYRAIVGTSHSRHKMRSPSRSSIGELLSSEVTRNRSYSLDRRQEKVFKNSVHCHRKLWILTLLPRSILGF